MWRRILALTSLFFAVFGFILFHCNIPQPLDSGNAGVKIILKSSNGLESSSSITDTLGNIDTIGVILKLTNFIDSATVKVISGSVIIYDSICQYEAGFIDTLYYPVSFTAVGTYFITVIGYINGQPNAEANATIHIIKRPYQNQKPKLVISGSKLIIAGETATLYVSATDSDEDQTVTIKSIKQPVNATFSANTFTWLTTLNDVGTDTVIFIAQDNGSPVLVDTDSVFITISATPVNRPPVWNPKSINLSGLPGMAITLSLADKCEDPDGNIMIYTLLAGTPAGDTVIDSTYSFTPANTDTGTYLIRIMAQDPSNTTDTLSITLTIPVDDRKSPVIQRITPSNDSLIVSSSIYQLQVSCKDQSSIASIKCTMGSDTFPVTKSVDTLYSASVTNLRSSEWNTIRFIATDASPAANCCTLYVYIKYDTTIPDTIAPKITLISPSTDTIIGVDSFAIQAKCTDPSGVTSLMGLLNATPFTMTKSAAVDSIWNGKVNGLPAGIYATLKLIATDASTSGNKDSVSVRIKCDNDIAGPVVTRVMPAGDSVSTNASSYTITVSCTDPSGVASVKGALGTQLFPGSKTSGNTWSISVSGLVQNTINTVVITATDSSLKTNSSLLNFHISYDPTMLDTIGPMIIQKSGLVSGAIVPNAVIEIIDSVFDPSNIDSIYWTKNNGAKKSMSSVTGGNNQYSLKDTLHEDRFDTLIITAVDKSTRHNYSTQTFILKYIETPAITVQPMSKKVCPNSETTVSVTATGTAPLLYQWHDGNGTISGAKSASYTFSSTTTNKIVTCVVSNDAVTKVISNPCTLTVNSEVLITTQPKDTTRTCQGTNTTISVAATGGTDLEYQWYGPGTSKVSGIGYSGITNADLTVPGTTAAQGKYYCIVINSDGCSATSNEGVFTLNNEVVVQLTSTSATTCPDTNVTFTVVPTGGTSHQYQWYRNGNTVGIPTTVATYATSIAGTYTCMATCGAGCSGTSNAVILTVNTESTDPTSASASATTVTSGTADTLRVVGGSLGTGAAWRWFTGTSCSGTSIGNGSSFVVNPTITTTYSAHAEGGCKTTNCVSVTVTVQNPPSVTPILVSPGNDSNGVPTTKNMTWNQVTGATGYTLQVSTNISFTSTVINVTKSGATNTSHAVTSGLSNSTRYYWRVRASNDGGDGPWGVDSFITVITWTLKNNGLDDENSLNIKAIAGTSEYLFIGTAGGVYRSTNNGDSWASINSGLSDINIHKLAVNGAYLLAATSSGIFRSTNNGDSWSLSTPTVCSDLSITESIVLAGSYVDGLFYSFNNGSTWTTPENFGLATEWGDLNIFNALVSDGSTIYGATDEGIYTSTNNGAVWNSNLRGIIKNIALINSNLFASKNNDGIYISQDNGNNWTLSKEALSCKSIAGSGTKIFAMLSFEGSIYFSQNSGNSWIKTSNLPGSNGDGSIVAVIGGYVFAGTRETGILRSSLP